MVNAWWLSEAATLVYADPEFVTENFKKAGFQEVNFFYRKTAECFVASDDKFAIVAFRGSEVRLKEGETDYNNIFADWIANFNFLPEEWQQGGKVHRGFKAALDEVWEELEKYISNLNNIKRKIWMTGHSLGAALATLAADRYRNVKGLYTYGSPRVGDKDFKKNFRMNTCRFVNNNDIVTKVPPAGMYRHVGELRHIDGDGVIRDKTNPWEGWFTEIQEKSINLLNTFNQDGKGLTEVFLEPFVDHVPTLYSIHIWNNIPEVTD